MTKQLYSVSVYVADRAYGGPEEGGWWYTTLDPCDDLAQFTRLFTGTEEAAPHAAHIYRERLERKLCAKLNAGSRPISSVLSSGELWACIEEGYPKAAPARRPHYE